MQRLVPFALVVLLIAMLGACGGSPTPPDPDPDPDPDPTLALTGVTPTVALPGASVVLQGTGFEAGQAVTFDGVAVTITAVTETTITVVVPGGFGYPTIAVEDVAKERLLFVGTVFSGDQSIDAVQAALDALPENAALRLPAGSYAAPGTSLDLDNRQLFGAGAGTVLDTPDGLYLFTRSTNLTVLQDLSVIGGGDLFVSRGRILTLALDAEAPYGGVLFQDVDLTVGALEPDDDYLHVRIRGATVDAASFYTDSNGSVIEIEDSTFVVSAGWSAENYGKLTVRDTTVDAGGDIYVYIDYVLGTTFERATLTAGASVSLFSYDPVVPTELVLRDSDVTAGSYVYLGSSGAPIVIEGSTITAVEYIDVDADDYGAFITMTDASLTAGTSVDLGDGYAGMTVTRSTVTAGTWLDVDGYGPLVFVDSTLTSESAYVAFYTDYSDAILFLGSSATAATYVDFLAYGPISVAGGSLEAGTYIQLFSSYAGEITVRDTTSIAAGTYFGFYDGGSSYAGNNGTFTFEGNASTTAGDYFELDAWYSDLVVRGNGPIEAADVQLYGQYSHVTIADNARIESAADITIYAATGGGGRIAVTNNAFVANAGAGTITIETEAGGLTQSGNTFTGTLVTPNN